MLKFSSKGRKAGVIFMALAVIVITVFATPAPAYAYGTYDTESFDVTMDVYEDNTIKVTEVIKIDAYASMHGIYRYVPLKGTAYMQSGDETLEINRAMKIKDIDVEGYEYETYTENGNCVIKIGSGNYTISGPQEYVITYTCVLYDDGMPEMDFFYYNVIPQGWETSIPTATVTINMPKEINPQHCYVYVGSYGYADENRAEWNVSGNTMTISASELWPYEGITALSLLPEGYFVNEANNDWAVPLAYVIIALAVILAAVLWYFFGRDPKVVQTVEFYPPEGITPADAGIILDGMVDKQDLISMIIYFADRGYLRIEEKDETADMPFALEKKGFHLTKIADIAEEESTFAHTLFNGLFEKGDSVMLSELTGSYYAHYSAASSQLYAKYAKDKESRIFTVSSTIARVVSYILGAVPFVAAIGLSGLGAYDDESIFFALPVGVVAIVALMGITVAYDKRHVLSQKKYKGMMILGIAGFAFTSVVAALLCNMYGNLFAAIPAATATIAIAIFSMLMYKRTKKSAELLGKLLGFKEFIRISETDRLKLLVEENPEYFYNVLPYAYIFGLSDSWAKKFESIAIEPPTWYNSGMRYSTFNAWIFMNTFNNCTNAFSQNIAVPPANSGGAGGIGGLGGFGGGGGFSGGGFGGGGGGGW